MLTSPGVTGETTLTTARKPSCAFALCMVLAAAGSPGTVTSPEQPPDRDNPLTTPEGRARAQPLPWPSPGAATSPSPDIELPDDTAPGSTPPGAADETQARP